MGVLHRVMEDHYVDRHASYTQDHDDKEEDVKPEHLTHERYLLELVYL